MNDKIAATKQIDMLKNKLDAAKKSHSALDVDFKTQMSLLTQFIGKLSQTSKGIDVQLDNKLATLRQMLTKSAPLSDIENLIKIISVLLQKHSLTNEHNIRQMHEQFKNAGLTLQKSSGLPDKLRRELRSLLSETEQHKDALVQYIPLLSKLLTIYDNTLKAKSSSTPEMGLLTSAANVTNNQAVADNHVDHALIERFSNILSNLTLSDLHTQQIIKIKSTLEDSMSNDKLLNSFLAAFDVIVEDLKQERNTAKVFLHTLSETLSTVQSAVKTTLAINKSNCGQHDEINNQLNKQIAEMASGLDNANSLADVKVDINAKLQLIAKSLAKKVSLEKQQQQQLESQLVSMTEKVNHLEEQSLTFERRIKEQQAKSMQDALTKLSNRAAFDDYFAKTMVRFHHDEFELAVAVLDLDDFKRINDTYGHTAGDKTLQVIANTLTKKIGDDAFIGRYGGEEFVLIFSNFNKTQVLEKLDKLRQQVARLPFKFKNNKVTITTSIGVCHVKKNDNIHIAFERADTALYQAKAKGKNTIVYL